MIRYKKTWFKQPSLGKNSECAKSYDVKYFTAAYNVLLIKNVSLSEQQI